MTRCSRKEVSLMPYCTRATFNGSEMVSFVASSYFVIKRSRLSRLTLVSSVNSKLRISKRIDACRPVVSGSNSLMPRSCWPMLTLRHSAYVAQAVTSYMIFFKSADAALAYAVKRDLNCFQPPRAPSKFRGFDKGLVST